MEEQKNSDRLYWLKLKRDFFKRHDVKVVEKMENGKDYILFYLKLLCESLDHNGNLRFSDTIPYDESMLSAITDVNIDIVRSAMKIFISLNLIEVLEDKTIYMCEIEKLAGSESKWAEIKRLQRAEIGQCPKPVLELSKNVQQENRDKSIESIKEERDKEEIAPQSVAASKKFKKPTLEEIKEYCQERNNNVDPQAFYNFYESKGWVVGKSPMKNWKAAIHTWEQRDKPNKSQQGGMFGNIGAINYDGED